MRGVLARFPGRRSSWGVVAVWLVLVAAFAPFGSKVPDITNDEYGLPGKSQTALMSGYLRERFRGGDQRTALIVYRREGGLTEADKARIAEDARAVASIEHVARPIPPFVTGSPPGLVSREGDVAFTVVPLEAPKVFRVTPTTEALREETAGSGGLETHVTGFPAIVSDYNTAIESADVKLLGATVLLVLLLLIAVYRSPVLALVPLVVVGSAYAVVLGMIYVFNKAFGLPVDRSSTSLLLVLMFGAGTDYCLLFVARYRSRLQSGEPHDDAIRKAIPEAAPAMIASGLTVIAALVVMLAGIFGINRTLGPVNAIGVGLVLIASLTLLPAVLRLLGPRAFWPTKPVTNREPDNEAGGRWHAIGVRVRQRPALWLVVSIVLLGVGTSGLTLWKTELNPVEQFRTANDASDGFRILQSAFPPGTVYPTNVLIERTDGAIRTGDTGAVRQRLTEVPGVVAVLESGRRSIDGRAVLLSAIYADDPFAAKAMSRTQQVRDAVAEESSGLRVLVGGGSGERLDARNASVRDLKVIVPLVLLVVLITLIVLLRALVAPLFLMVTVVASFAATLGTTLLFFRYVLDQHAFNTALPLIIFIFLVALGSDYNIFLMSRVREEAERHGTREGMLRALVATGPVITSAGLVLAGTFAVLTIIPSYDLDMIGFAVALGVLVDTFLVRSICVPAIVWLLGDRTWWPSSPGAGRQSPVVSGVYSTQELLGVERDS